MDFHFCRIDRHEPGYVGTSYVFQSADEGWLQESWVEFRRRKLIWSPAVVQQYIIHETAMLPHIPANLGTFMNTTVPGWANY